MLYFGGQVQKAAGVEWKRVNNGRHVYRWFEADLMLHLIGFHV